MKNIRTCIACRARKEKKELLRIVAKEGVAKLDESLKANARGIYICKDKACINKLLKTKDISKCIKIDVEMDSIKELLRNLGE